MVKNIQLLTERYSEKITGVISCFDRVVIRGTLPGFSHAEGMTSYLKFKGIRIFDYPRFAEPYREQLRENAEQIAKENNIEIEFIRKSHIRKEDIIQKKLKQRGNAPGLVHIISVMESCPSYKPWHNKNTGKTYLRYTQAKCLHYYFYFIDEELGLCYVRVPTWCPFQLQVYFNGHNLLAAALTRKGISFTLIDNAFTDIDSFEEAQAISDNLSVELIRQKLDRFAEKYCPIIEQFGLSYHWSIMQAEYATDIVFHNQEDLQPLYENLTRTAIHTVKPDNIATFLGRKLHGNFEGEMGNAFNTRIEGTRIKHTMDSVSIKMYDKFGSVLRIETTVNDVSFFKHYREVEHRDGSTSKKLASMKKNIYSLPVLALLLAASNRRYIQFISSFDDHTDGLDKLNYVTKSVIENNRCYKGFNFFSDEDQILFESIASGDFTISGFRNKHLRRKLKTKSSSQISRILKRLHTHGLIKKTGRSYKYYLTKLGLQIITLGLKLKHLVITPELASNPCG